MSPAMIPQLPASRGTTSPVNASPHPAFSKRPRVLFVTPEISQVPESMGPGAAGIRVKSGGLADVSASLVSRFHAQGDDIHLAIPHYRSIFGNPPGHAGAGTRSRIHLGEDCGFYRRSTAYHGDPDYLRGAALAFQREVINHIIPLVKPDIVHCNDWMTGLIPAACKRLGIKTVFTLHNIHRERTTLAEIEYRGIDVRSFWDLLYFGGYPYRFDESYHTNPIDLLSSAIQNADYLTTVSPTFLDEITQGKHGDLPASIRWDIRAKIDAGYATGILNAPDPSYDPARDPSLVRSYTPQSSGEGKRLNKRALQKLLGLAEDPAAPVFFWPSRLDPIQKGCQLLSDILYETTARYAGEGIQFIIVGDGEHQCHFHDIVALHGLGTQVAVRSFDEELSRLAFAGSDFVLMPSSFEPCGLPQMIGARYGALPVVHNTGGLHDTVRPLKDGGTAGNGFVFDYFDHGGLRWAIGEAMKFFRLTPGARASAIARIMAEARQDFSIQVMAERYREAYSRLYADHCNNRGND